MADFDQYDNGGSGSGFMMGLLAGTVLGAGLGMLLAPKAGNELRGAIGEQARNLGTKASEGYRKASESATTWAEKGKEFVNHARESVSRGADEARSYASTSPSPGSGYGGSSIGSTSGSSFGNDRGTGGSFGQ